MSGVLLPAGVVGRCHILPAAALAGHPVQPGCGGNGAVKGQAMLDGGIHNEVGILARGVHGEGGRLQLVVEDEVHLQAEIGQVKRAAVEHVEELLRIDAQRLGKCNHFRRRRWTPR